MTFEGQQILSATLGKGFYLCQRRNEWVNWNGDTDVITRSDMTINLSLEEAELRAQRARAPGTRFVIQEIPIAIFRTAGCSAIVTEVSSRLPLAAYSMRRIPKDADLTIGALFGALPRTQNIITCVKSNAIRFALSDQIYFARVSSPGKGKSHLAWSLKRRKMSDAAVVELVQDVAAILSLYGKNGHFESPS